MRKHGGRAWNNSNRGGRGILSSGPYGFGGSGRGFPGSRRDAGRPAVDSRILRYSAVAAALVIAILLTIGVKGCMSGADDITEIDEQPGISFVETEAPADPLHPELPVFINVNNVSSNVGELLQLPKYPAGCESVALACLLQAYGLDVTEDEIIKEYLPIDIWYNDFLYHYGGSPYNDGMAFPPAIVRAANSYFEDNTVAAKAVDITGTSFEELCEMVEAGQPVLVWTTVYMESPWWSDMRYGPARLYNNEHCVVMYGVEGDKVLVSDPLEGLMERRMSDFKYIYEVAGEFAATIEPTLSPWRNPILQGAY